VSQPGTTQTRSRSTTGVRRRAGMERPRWHTVVMSTPSVMTRRVMASPISSRAVSTGTGPTPGISQISPGPIDPLGRRQPHGSIDSEGGDGHSGSLGLHGTAPGTPGTTHEARRAGLHRPERIFSRSSPNRPMEGGQCWKSQPPSPSDTATSTPPREWRAREPGGWALPGVAVPESRPGTHVLPRSGGYPLRAESVQGLPPGSGNRAGRTRQRNPTGTPPPHRRGHRRHGRPADRLTIQSCDRLTPTSGGLWPVVRVASP
jgi:hypothetical protein